MFASALDEARVLAMRGDLDPAIQKLSEFLNGDFYHDEALFMLGAGLIAKGMNGLGAVVTNAAIEARSAQKNKPFPEALVNLGGAYKAEHQHSMAERVWLEALKVETVPKERAKIFCNLAGLYVNDGRPEKAIEYCDLALREDPNNHGAHTNRGMASLELGRWSDGWRGWEHTYATGDRTKRVYPGIPEWDGTPGQTVIVWGDQGIGDEIMFASALKDMQGVCRRVILDCHPRLTALFKRSFPEIEVYGTRKDLSDLPWLDGCGADASFALGDLFVKFRNSDADWGEGTPYLKAQPMAYYREGMRIGISWVGGTKRTRNDLRCLSPEMFEPIVQARPDAQWFSLQYTPDRTISGSFNDAAYQVCNFEERTGIRIAHYPDWIDHYDYDRTASFVASLDLVITVCTTVHYLGGALGVPTWTLVPSRPSWRYMTKGERLPWYNSVRLFRQDGDDWRGPINRVAQELAKL